MSSNPIKTLANQLNALKSTGPRSAAGKAKASANSLKHGILSRNLIIPGENAANFEALLAQLLAEEQPVGTLEAALVERVAICLWRQRRTVTAESASLHLQRETLGAEDWQLLEQLTGVSDRGLILGTLRQGLSLAEAEDFAQVFDTWLALPDADKPQDLEALEAAFPPLVELLHGLLTADEAGLGPVPPAVRMPAVEDAPAVVGEADLAVAEAPAVVGEADLAVAEAPAVVGEADLAVAEAATRPGPASAAVTGDVELAVAAEEGGAGSGPGLVAGMAAGDAERAGDAAGALSLGEALAARSGGSLTELLYGVLDHLRQQLAILRAVSHLRAARLHLAAAEPMARYQAALDNELYKAIRALREAQAHRRANAPLEAVAAEAG